MDRTQSKSILEKSLDRKLVRWYIGVLNFYGNYSGYIPQLPESYKQDLKKILESHYQKVIDVYTIKGSSTINEMTAKIVSEIETEFREKIKLKTNDIYDTTIQKAVTIFALAMADETGKLNTVPEIRSIFKSTAKVEFRNKAKAESITVTNSSVEKMTLAVVMTSTEYMTMLANRASLEYQKGHDCSQSLSDIKKIAKASQRQSAEDFYLNIDKEIESGRIKEVGLIATAFLILTKSWLSVGDSHVRSSHRIAEMQGSIPINQPFIVGNSFMMFPSDDSLGAEYKEIAGCRCSAVYN
jgi:hypothetical protein